jgi:adenosylmethionine-8-amino-7-oxononanoate aminotransferase
LGDLPVRNLRQIGMIAAFEVASKQAGFQQKFYQSALARGLLLRPIDKTVYLMPPYVISESEIDWMVSELVTLIKELPN